MIYNDIRPTTIEKMYGQHLDPIREDIERNKVARSYLFYGPRGCGKTSTARIIANHLPSPKIIEVNVASDSTKKDAEKLISSLNSLPIGFKTKVIILDEIHKASPGFQNAILTPAESHPPGVYFIFCTTEISKVVDTLKSRCKKIEFKTLSKAEITEVLNDGRKACEVSTMLPDSIVALIYKKSTGSARDALTELELISYIDDEDEMLTRLKVTRSEDDPTVWALFNSLYAGKDRSVAIKKMNSLNRDNPEGVRRVLLTLCERKLIKGGLNEDAMQILYELIKIFNRKIFTDYIDLVECILDFYMEW